MLRSNYTSVPEEIFNAISHGIGALASIIGFVVLIIHARMSGQPVKFWALVTFGITMIILYLSSTLFHSLMFTRAQKIFKTIDYSAIALFIAGCYTPIAVVTLKDNFGWLLLLGVWTLTIIGVFWRIFGVKKDEVSLILYLLTGWLVMIYIKPLAQHLSSTALLTLILGGLFYTIGTIFFQWKKLVFGHGIWHLCVLGGSVCHFIMMLSL